jgi:WD40 repeat protein
MRPSVKHLLFGILFCSCMSITAFVLFMFSEQKDEYFISAIEFGEQIEKVAIRSDNTMIAAIGETGNIYLYNIPNKNLVHLMQLAGARALDFSEDGQLLLFGGDSGVLHVWDTTTNQAILQHPVINPVTSNRLVVLPDGSFTNKIMGINTIAVSRNGGLLAIGGVHGQVVVVDLQSIEHMRRFRSHPHEINNAFVTVSNVQFDTSGKRLLSGAEDGSVSIWDLTTNVQLCFLRPTNGEVKDISITSDGKALFAARWPNRITVWLIDGCHQSWEGIIPITDFSAIAMRADDALYVRGGHGTGKMFTGGLPFIGEPDPNIYIENINTFETIQTLKGHEDLITDIAISRDGCFLASGGKDQTIRWWRIAVKEKDCANIADWQS